MGMKIEDLMKQKRIWIFKSNKLNILRDNYHYANTEAVDTRVMLDRRIIDEI
jgi:hypothetical protein